VTKRLWGCDSVQRQHSNTCCNFLYRKTFYYSDRNTVCLKDLPFLFITQHKLWNNAQFRIATVTRLTAGCCCSYAVGRTTRRHPATSSRIFFPLHQFSPRSCHRLSTAEHIVYPCCSSSPRKTFSFYFTLNCSQNHAITSSFPVAVLREFPMFSW